MSNENKPDATVPAEAAGAPLPAAAPAAATLAELRAAREKPRERKPGQTDDDAKLDAELEAIEAAAHGGYVAAINSNNVDTLMEGLTDDVVLQAPGAPEIIGKAAVREWVGGYFGAGCRYARHRWRVRGQ